MHVFDFLGEQVWTRHDFITFLYKNILAICPETKLFNYEDLIISLPTLK